MSLVGCSPSDRVFVVDAAGGYIQFGDGESGARPPSGVEVSAVYSVATTCDGSAPAGGQSIDRPDRIQLPPAISGDSR